MNSLVNEHSGILNQTIQLRRDLMDTLNDDDLTFALPNNPTLGALCREMAEVEQSYINSFKSFQHDYRLPCDTSKEGSVEALKAWFAQTEGELQQALAGLTEDQVQGQMVDRGHGMQFPVLIQWQVYREALLIFYAKAVVYLRAMEKPVPQMLGLWVG